MLDDYRAVADTENPAEITRATRLMDKAFATAGEVMNTRATRLQRRYPDATPDQLLKKHSSRR